MSVQLAVVCENVIDGQPCGLERRERDFMERQELASSRSHPLDSCTGCIVVPDTDIDADKQLVAGSCARTMR
jgi:hypothetical protein